MKNRAFNGKKSNKIMHSAQENEIIGLLFLTSMGVFNIAHIFE